MDKHTPILITGGAGFIGSNIVDRLVKDGFLKITVLDNLETGSVKNIQEHIDSSRITFVKGDITNRKTCDDVCKGIQIILHQAALGSVPRSIENPINTFDVNVTGFMNMLEAARKHKVKRFVYASSSSVYGDDKTLPKTEDRVGNPLSPYAVSKKTNELFGNVFSELYGMEIIGLRYFNVFGPKQNPNGPYAAVIPIFIHHLLQNKECSIFGDGSNRRDFTYIDNVVQANILAMSTENKEATQGVYNVAFGATMSINQLYDLVCTGLKSNLKPIYKAPRAGEIKDSFANIDRAKKLLNYSPQIPLEKGIELSIEWYKNNLSN